MSKVCMYIYMYVCIIHIAERGDKIKVSMRSITMHNELETEKGAFR